MDSADLWVKELTTYKREMNNNHKKKKLKWKMVPISYSDSHTDTGLSLLKCS